MKKIGIEVSNLIGANPEGIGVYARNLVVSLLKNKDFTSNFDLKLLYKFSKFRMRKYIFKPFPGSVKWYMDGIFPFRQCCDLVHSPDLVFVPWKKAIKIFTIHDLAIFKKEFQFGLFASERFRNKKWIDCVKIIKNSDHIIVDSDSTRKDLLELFDFPEKKVSVVYLAVKPEYYYENINRPLADGILKKYNLCSGYLLFVGAVSIRKNLVNLIKAYHRSGIYRDHKLALVGNLSHGNNEILSVISGLNLNDRVVLTGYIPEEHLPYFYLKAKAFLFPTFYEGFGMPILEAMAAKVPVLVGNRGSSVEIAEDFAVVSDPFDIDSIADGIIKVVGQTGSKLESAKEHAKKFTWEKCAQRTLEVYMKFIV